MDTKKSTMATPTLETFANQTQIFASAWSLINSQFGGEDSLELAEVERGILLDMARRLIEDHDAARQEIASLRAQPYDQQAMGLCHVCGWKGVIDYPDGPVCVACEHDKTLPPQPAAQPLHVAATSCPHEIDKDKIVLHFDSKQPGKNALAQLAARLQAAQAQVVPAPGVEAVSEREFKQFLSDVITASGLVTHGNKCKDLGRRLGEMSMRLRTAPKTAAAPVQALDALKEIGAIAVSALETNSRYIADWREDMDRIAAIAAQEGDTA